MRSSEESALLTDFYQLTMLAAYFEEGMTETAVFEFFVRKRPECRNFFLACGLEPALDYLENFAFTQEEIDWIARLGRFKPAFLDWLASLRFTGDVDAMPEGTPFFPHEPILRVVAPLPEAQIVETRLINLLQLSTLTASKAARVRLAAGDALLVDFGLRRAHGAEAGMLSARASYLAGFDGTSNTLAGMRWDIPVYGTMAHSFVQAHVSELSAFEAFARIHPAATTLLIDTYDTEAAAEALVPLAHTLRAEGIALRAVRLDSGDLAAHARRVRAILDAAGLAEIKIFASGNLDEYEVERLRAQGAPIDGFGVGTRMNVSADAPYLDCAYKLQEYAGKPRRKRSEGKATWPGRKQVFRRYDEKGRLAGDLLTLVGEEAEGEPLLQPVMRAGKRLRAAPPLSALRAQAMASLNALPPPLKSLGAAPPYPVAIGDALTRLAQEIDAQAH
ncbi:MAG: nicotinate phosphoribosyltransferase [Rhodocyclaceae bacterium]|nr:nicotinate phosphoribosyltransferase [Rhodocyclaceae bacterium]